MCICKGTGNLVHFDVSRLALEVGSFVVLLNRYSVVVTQARRIAAN